MLIIYVTCVCTNYTCSPVPWQPSALPVYFHLQNVKNQDYEYIHDVKAEVAFLEYISTHKHGFVAASKVFALF